MDIEIDIPQFEPNKFLIVERTSSIFSACPKRISIRITDDVSQVGMTEIFQLSSYCVITDSKIQNIKKKYFSETCQQTFSTENPSIALFYF